MRTERMILIALFLGSSIIPSMAATPTAESPGNGVLLALLTGVIAFIAGAAAAIFIPKLLHGKESKGRRGRAPYVAPKGSRPAVSAQPHVVAQSDNEPHAGIKPQVQDSSELRNTIEELEKKNIALSANLRATTQKLEDERAAAQDNIAAEKARLEKSAQMSIAEVRAQADKLIKESETRARQAEDRIAQAEAAAGKAADVARAECGERISFLEKAEEQLKEELSDTKNALAQTERSLQQETLASEEAKREVERMNKEIARVSASLGDVAFAQPYCREIENLFSLSKKIQASANTALSADVEDPYFIFKAVARFGEQSAEIDLQQFYTDVRMIVETGFAPKGTPLTSYSATNQPEELESLTRTYFFVNYLKQYINALVVFNESMAGLSYLVPDMPAQFVQPFMEYRNGIREVSESLGIEVVTVKIFDSVFNNTDLLATQIDAGFETPGAILDIENCLVSLAGSPRDSSERIHVKVQQ